MVQKNKKKYTRKKKKDDWKKELGSDPFREGNCVFTGELYECEVPTDGLNRWSAGETIQTAMPKVSADDREFLISGISPKGWSSTFG